MAIQILLNGKNREITPGQTLAQLVSAMDLGDKRIAVEVNEEIIPRSQYRDHRLQPGDQVEVVTAIGGG